MSFFAAALLLLSQLTACKERLPAIVVGRLLLDVPREFDAQATGREELRASLQRQLASERAIQFVPDHAQANYIVQFRLGERQWVSSENDTAAANVEDPPKKAKEVRQVQVRLRPFTESLPLYETSVWIVPEAGHEAILSGFKEAMAMIQRERALDLAPDAVLIETLKDNDPRLRDFAITRLGDRKSKEAVPALSKLLSEEPRQDLVLRSVGSLVAIGDPAAVVPIIDLSTQKSPDVVLQMIFAVAAIGGSTAEAFLVTMATGHPIESVQSGAKQALTELERRKRETKEADRHQEPTP